MDHSVKPTRNVSHGRGRQVIAENVEIRLWLEFFYVPHIKIEHFLRTLKVRARFEQFWDT